jgi:RNA polymerase sigma factor (sigma-70 family)
MREHNNGAGESNDLQNRFTAYLITAVRRRKIQYFRSKSRQYKLYEMTLELQEQTEDDPEEPDMTAGLPLLDQLENVRLRQSLENAKERELYIFLAKALEGRSFAEIAAELGIGYNTTASIYYRMINRLIRELRGEDV